jgi:hypothetical protein
MLCVLCYAETGTVSETEVPSSTIGSRTSTSSSGTSVETEIVTSSIRPSSEISSTEAISVSATQPVTTITNSVNVSTQRLIITSASASSVETGKVLNYFTCFTHRSQSSVM